MLNSKTAFISLGSNSSDAMYRLDSALKMLNLLKGVKVSARSPVFFTEPQGRRDQNWFYNLAVMVSLDMEWHAPEFLAAMLEIEKKLGRERGQEIRFGPRPIDLDLICFGIENSSDPDCILPHPRAERRAFVLVPLFTIFPGLFIGKKNVVDCLARINWRIDGWKIWQNDVDGFL